MTLLGRNGAGKTTTLKSIMGVLAKRKGSVVLEGKETIALPSRAIARMGIGFVPEERGIYAQETNRLNRERRSNGDAWRAELPKVEKQIAGIVEAIADGMYHSSMKQKLTGLEARKQELTALLADAPVDEPDLLPSAASIYAQKIAALAEALNQPDERAEAAEALRMLIEKIVLTPGPQRGEIHATLHGELATILEWTQRQATGKIAKKKTPAAKATGVSESVVAGARFELTTFRL